MKTRSVLLLTGFSLIISLMALAQQQPAQDQIPTLADIARQKRAEKAKKVFTSEDMKAAEPEPAAAAEGAGADGATKTAVPQNDEAIAAAQAKVEDLRYREVVTNKTLARLEGSLAQAQQEGNEDRVKSFTESIEQAKANLTDIGTQLKAAEQQLMEMKIAAATAAATKKKPAKKPAAPKS